MRQQTYAAIGLIAAGLLAGCGTSSNPGGEPIGGGDGGEETVGRTFLISPGLAAMVQARPKDTIEFDCGYFELDTGFQLTNTEDVLVKGCGIDDTVLSFKNSQAQEGFLAINVRGVVVEDLTVQR